VCPFFEGTAFLLIECMQDVKHKFWIFLSNVIVIGDFVENYQYLINYMGCKHLRVVGSALIRVLFTLLACS